jgi:hypothetical protein
MSTVDCGAHPTAERVSSISCQRVSVTAMAFDVLVDAAGHRGRAGALGACGHALTRARIDLGCNPRRC